LVLLQDLEDALPHLLVGVDAVLVLDRGQGAQVQHENAQAARLGELLDQIRQAVVVGGDGLGHGGGRYRMIAQAHGEPKWRAGLLEWEAFFGGLPLPILARILRDRGVITERQLQEAIQQQVLYGGRLGTSLYELGFITEERLR